MENYKTPTEGVASVTPSMSAVRALGEAGTCVLTTEGGRDASNGPHAPTGASSASLETESTPERPLPGDTPLER